MNTKSATGRTPAVAQDYAKPEKRIFSWLDRNDERYTAGRLDCKASSLPRLNPCDEYLKGYAAQIDEKGNVNRHVGVIYNR